MDVVLLKQHLQKCEVSLFSVYVMMNGISFSTELLAVKKEHTEVVS